MCFSLIKFYGLLTFILRCYSLSLDSDLIGAIILLILRGATVDVDVVVVVVVVATDLQLFLTSQDVPRMRDEWGYN